MTAAVSLVCLVGGRWHRHIAARLGLLGVLWWGFGLLPLPPTNWFSISNATFLLPFLMSGYLTSQTPSFRQTLCHARWARPLGALLLSVGLYIGYRLATQELILSGAPRRLLAIILGLLACFGLLMLRPHQTRLASIGTKAYAIYLFHVFFTAAVTHAWWHFDAPGHLWAITVLGVIFGLAGPILLQALILRSPIAAQTFLGLPAAKVRDVLRKEKERTHTGIRTSNS